MKLYKGSLKLEQNIFLSPVLHPPNHFTPEDNSELSYLRKCSWSYLFDFFICIHGKAICLIAKRPFLFSWIGRGVREEENKRTFQGKWKPCKEEIIMRIKLRFRMCWKMSIGFCLKVTQPFFLTPTLYHLVASKSKGHFSMRRWTVSF